MIVEIHANHNAKESANLGHSICPQANMTAAGCRTRPAKLADVTGAHGSNPHYTEVLTPNFGRQAFMGSKPGTAAMGGAQI